MYYGWLTADERLAHFSKARDRILRRAKVAKSPSIQGPQSSEGDLVVLKKDPIRTDMSLVSKSSTNRNHVSVCSLWKNDYISYSR